MAEARQGSASLQSYLESRLRLRSASGGGTLWLTIWKILGTPLGRRYSVLRGSAASISVIGYTLSGWPTPIANWGYVIQTPEQWAESNAKLRKKHPNQTKQRSLAVVAQLAEGRTRLHPYSWETLRQAHSPVRFEATGRMLTGSSAATGNGAQLSPAHPRWIMGLPPE
jgi:hypothetical protein